MRKLIKECDAIILSARPANLAVNNSKKHMSLFERLVSQNKRSCTANIAKSDNRSKKQNCAIKTTNNSITEFSPHTNFDAHFCKTLVTARSWWCMWLGAHYGMQLCKQLIDAHWNCAWLSSRWWNCYILDAFEIGVRSRLRDRISQRSKCETWSSCSRNRSKNVAQFSK